jgi:hypothetical protein
MNRSRDRYAPSLSRIEKRNEAAVQGSMCADLSQQNVALRASPCVKESVPVRTVENDM